MPVRRFLRRILLAWPTA